MSAGGDHHGSGGLPFLHDLQGWLGKAHEEGGLVLSVNPLFFAFIAEIVAFFMVAPAQTVTNFQFLLFISPLWIPIFLFNFALIRFIDANRLAWINKQEHVLLEIRMPRDTRRTPLAMETVLSSMHIGGGETTWYKRVIEGRARPWYSYEIASLGGQLHFFVWTRAQFRRPLESFLYAQYPGVEVIEAMDYSRLVDPSHHPYTMTAFEFTKGSPNPLPIKSYIDYGLDQVQKPEEQVDPLAQLLEVMGSIGPKEQMWLQLVVRTHSAKPSLGVLASASDWKEEAKAEITKIREETLIETEIIDAQGNKKKIKNSPNATEGQKDRIKAIERNTGKLAYDIGIRGVYFAPEDSAYGIMGGILANLFKPFNSESYNSLGPAGRWSNHSNDYPWEDPHGHHNAHAMHSVLALYRMRAFYHPPYVGKYSVMSTEELATLFHVPSSSVTTPSLPRIQSTTSEAPTNLPI